MSPLEMRHGEQPRNLSSMPGARSDLMPHMNFRGFNAITSAASRAKLNSSSFLQSGWALGFSPLRVCVCLERSQHGEIVVGPYHFPSVAYPEDVSAVSVDDPKPVVDQRAHIVIRD